MPRNAKNSASATTTAALQEKRKVRRGLILLAVFAVVIVGCGVLLYWLDHQFFDRNKRFTLEHIELYNNGYWGKTKETRNELFRFIKLHAKEQNLFEISPAKLRAKLKCIANIADAGVERVLPDTVVIRLEERVPRAFLGHVNSEYVIDADGMVMNANQCFGVHPKLPAIVGIRTQVTPCTALASVDSALELIMQVNRAFPEFHIEFISVIRADELFFKLTAHGRDYMVTMPRKNIADMLDVLRSTVDDCRARHDEHKKINLTFDRRVVLGN